MKNIPIFDGHNDSILEVFTEKRNFFVRNEEGHIDLPRAKEGNMKAGFFAIWIPPENVKERAPRYGLKTFKNGWEVEYAKSLNFKYAKNFTNDLLELSYSFAKSKEIKMIKKIDDLDECFQKELLGMILHFEGAEAIDENLSNLEYYYEKGLRSLGFVWSRSNAFGYGVPFKFPSSGDIGPGLTAAGKKLVSKCNEMGIIIDLAHINEKGFWDVAKLSKAPLVVSHGNVHALCPCSRNLTDRQIDAVASSGGIIGINFSILFLRKDGELIADTPLKLILDHIDYIVKRVGVDHVGFGSDFDGTQVPNDLKSIADMPKLLEDLKNNGYKHEDIEKIAYKNWRRVIKDSWK